MAEMIKFFKGAVANLPAAGVNGALYITNDEGAIYLGTGTGMKRLGDFIQVDAVANLPTNGANVSALYYCVAENVLAKWNGSEWIQINKQPTADQIKTMIGLADYETKTDAAQKLADAKAYTNTEVAKVQKEVDDLEKYVGTIPETSEAADIVAYVQEKTAGIATDTALEELTGRVAENEKDIKALQDANAEGGAVHTAIATAQGAAEAADAKAAQAQKEVDELEKVVSDYKTANDTAVQEAKDAAGAAQDAADAAQDDVDALAEKVGEIPDGETVVNMISDVNTLAADAKRSADAKVASVTAGDASITVGGEGTAPTVSAKLSADADNALKLVEDGLKVVIPAAAAYSIVKAEDSGDYAAVYNLTKDGTIVGASINIPKDLVVKSGKVEGGNIVLVLNDEANTEITIPASSLIEYVTSGSQTGDMVVISVSDDHKVTATITDGTVGIEKLTTDVQTKINKAHSHENADVLAGITADHVAAWDKAEANATKVATDFNTAMNTRVEKLEAIDHEHGNKDVIDGITAQNITDWNDAVAKEHEHTNKELLDSYTQTEEDLADAVAKKHAHENAEELAKIASGDVAKWNAAQANAEATAATALNEYKESNDAAVAKKANSADVYAKTETYTQEEVDAAIAEAVEAQMSWGSFGE